jgi:2-polyprenyl-3-methyl-5-hydroxy-6-metoxy-1,4-benzoquinol methylase
MKEPKYEKYYQEGRNILGEPFKEFVQFFNNYEKKDAQVLDIGCGQGRDALFIARLGHSVFGIDLSNTGISQMLEDAEQEQLDVTGLVADVTNYSFKGKYDVGIVDRTLHMIADAKQRHETLLRAANSIEVGGYLLIADEKKNVAGFKKLLMADNWKIDLEKGGFLFLQKWK